MPRPTKVQVYKNPFAESEAKHGKKPANGKWTSLFADDEFPPRTAFRGAEEQRGEFYRSMKLLKAGDEKSITYSSLTAAKESQHQFDYFAKEFNWLSVKTWNSKLTKDKGSYPKGQIFYRSSIRPFGKKKEYKLYIKLTNKP